MTDIAIVLRVACILAIQDIETGFPQKAKYRLESILSCIDERMPNKPDDALSCQERQDRRLCTTCGKPWIGEDASCHCGFESLEEKETFFRTSPKSKKANKPDGGKGHGHLRFRRARAGY